LREKLGVVLFQLPPFFKKDLPRLNGFLGLLPAGLKGAFEFRHPSWFADDTFDGLRARNIALCIAESESLATPVVVTADYTYFRLRREDYTPKDVERWAKIIAEQPLGLKDHYVYFKHEEAGKGPILAKQLMERFDLKKPDAERLLL
jgi:uncharacterized protein YecE (DUF72 family)